jgi:hypothetical protein
MSDLTGDFNGLLKQHEAAPTGGAFSLDKIDDFLKEAYRIVSAFTPSGVGGPVEADA